MSDFIKIGPISNFPENQTTAIKIGEADVCVANYNGKLTAFNDSCTHAQAMLSGCDIEDGGEVACPLHGARFSVETGEALSLPAVKPVRMHSTKIEKDTLFIKLNEQN